MYHQHIMSIDCRRDFENHDSDMLFLILDDITTTGSIMEVSRDILIDYNVNEDNIFSLAIAQTKQWGLKQNG